MCVFVYVGMRAHLCICEDTGIRVCVCACVRAYVLTNTLRRGRLLLRDVDGREVSDAEVLPVEGLGEVVAVVQQELPPQHVHRLACDTGT